MTSTPVYPSTVSLWEKHLPEIQCTLLVTIVAMSALIIFAPQSIKIGCSIALRSITLLSAGGVAISCWNRDRKIDRFSKCSKVVLIALSLIAVASASKTVALGSLGGCLGLAVVDLTYALKEKNFKKGLIETGFLLINALAFSAILTNSWLLIVLASSVNAVVLGSLGLYAFKRDKMVGLSYLALGVLSGYAAHTSIPAYVHEEKGHFILGYPSVKIVERNNIVATSEVHFLNQHGEEVKWCIGSEEGYAVYEMDVPTKDLIDGLYLNVTYSEGEFPSWHLWYDFIYTDRVHAPIDPALFTALPLGSTATILDESLTD